MRTITTHLMAPMAVILLALCGPAAAQTTGGTGTGSAGSTGAPTANQSIGGASTPTQPSTPPRGTNSAGTANSSGGPAASSGTVGMANDHSDVKLDEKETRDVDKKIKSICKGC
jgi:hypothetical protein